MGGFRRLQRPFQVLIIGAILAGAGVYGYGQSNNTTTTTTTTPAVGTANMWVSSAGTSSCTRSSTAVVYATALSGGNVCDTIDRAYHAAANGGGDVALVRCGSYGRQVFTAKTLATAMTTIQSETPGCATIQSATAASSILLSFARWVTIKDFTINSPTVGVSAPAVQEATSGGSAAVTQQTNHVTFDSNLINVGWVVGGRDMDFYAAQDLRIINNTIGPSIPLTISCSPNCQSPEGIRIAHPVTTAPDCTNNACNVEISGNLFQFIGRDCTLWPVSGFGSCPGVTCSNANGCHQDAIHVFGCDTCQFNNNRFYGNECNNIFIEDTNNQLNKDIDIIGNFSAALANQCNGGVTLNIKGGANGYAGTFNIKFNSLGSGINLLVNVTMTAPITVNMIGNFGSKLVNGTLASGCTNSAGITFNFKYNVWTNAGACDATDIANQSTSSWPNYAQAPAVGQDMHITSGPAIDFVPTSVTGGCPAADLDGDAPGNPCNAGGDQ